MRRPTAATRPARIAPRCRVDPSPIGLGDSSNGWKNGVCVNECVYNVFLRVPLAAGRPARIAVRFAAGLNTPLPTLVPLATRIAGAPVPR